MKIWILIALVSLFVSDAPPPTYSVHRTATPPTIDGRGDDAVWKTAATMVLSKTPGGDRAEPASIVRLLWDDQNLYLHARLEDPDIATHFVTRDSSMWTNDVFEVFLDVDGDQVDYLEFEINPKNAFFDALLPRFRVLYRAYNANIRHVVRVHGTLDDDSDTDRAWEIEMAFPFAEILPETKAPEVPKIQPNAIWRANFYRGELSRGERTNQAWSPVRSDFHELDRFGRLRFVEGDK